MAYDVDDISKAIATSLTGLQSDEIGVQSVPYELSNPSSSGIYVSEGDFLFHQAQGDGMHVFEMMVTILVGFSTDQGAQRRLRKLRDAAKPLLEADKTLGGRVDHAHVTKASRPRLYGPDGGKRLLGCLLTVEIFATP